VDSIVCRGGGGGGCFSSTAGGEGVGQTNGEERNFPARSLLKSEKKSEEAQYEGGKKPLAVWGLYFPIKLSYTDNSLTKE